MRPRLDNAFASRCFDRKVNQRMVVPEIEEMIRVEASGQVWVEGL